MGVPSWGRWPLLIPKISTTSSRAGLKSARKPSELSTIDKPRGRSQCQPQRGRTPRVPSWEEGITSSSSTYTSSDNEEEEGEEAINQLVILAAEPEVLNAAKPIPISNSDNEHSDDLTYTALQLIGEVEVAHSFRKGNKYDTSSGSANMAPRFKTLGQKKSTPAASAELSLSEAPLLGKQLARGPSKKVKKKKGEMSYALLPYSSAQAELWNPKFSTTELGKQSIEIKKSKKKISSLEKQAKLDSKAMEKAKLELVVVVQKRDASYAAITKAQSKEAVNEFPGKTPKVANKIVQEVAEVSIAAEAASPKLSPNL
ncbi:hypothetical protein Acr_22g0002360 [Actinidia rufa]|uniref:Uncharacterized protein n=1 Tax=Actinidia rufa TaxID=165716 RepID=A0A7J0GJB3_9ERIC|nr:hypothetical protein Acr_22g0002360 [Actinidia rufa]